MDADPTRSAEARAAHWMAVRTSGTSRTVMLAGPVPLPAGTSAKRHPGRAASGSGRGTGPTGRTSPVTPTSPIATRSAASGRSCVADATASAIPRSAAGSTTRIPPTVAANTSRSCSLVPARRCRTASTMASRAESSPDTVRRGEPATWAPMSACTSVTSARRPSIATVTQVPAVGAGRGDGLYRVDDQQPGPARVEVPEQRLQVGLGGQVQPLVQGTEPLGPQAYLAGGLLARDDQGRAARPGGPLLGDVEQQGGLADAGLAGQEDDRPGDQSATEYPVQLAHAGRPVPGRLSADRGDRSGRFQRRPGGETAQGRREAGTAGRVDDRAPLAALGTAADPLRGPVPAGVALVGRPAGPWLGGCHERTVPGGYDRSATTGSARLRTLGYRD